MLLQHVLLHRLGLSPTSLTLCAPGGSQNGQGQDTFEVCFFETEFIGGKGSNVSAGLAPILQVQPELSKYDGDDLLSYWSARVQALKMSDAP